MGRPRGLAPLAPGQAAAEAAGARADTASLGEDAVYAGDVGRLDDDRVVTVWADLEEVARLVLGAAPVPRP